MKCKDCGADGFKSPWEIRKHKDAGHVVDGKARDPRTAPSNGERPKRKYTRRAAARATTSRRSTPRLAKETPGEPVVDSEAKLLLDVTNCFRNAETDREADFRVLEYIAQRFGPAAYEGVEEE